MLTCFYRKVFYLGVGFFQLAKVDSVGIISTFCYIMNLLIAHAYIGHAQYNTFKCQTVFINYEIFLVLVQLHRNCISIANSNTLACGIFSIGVNGRKVYAYAIIIFASYCQCFII